LRHWPGNIRELLVEIRAAAQEAAAASSKRVKVEHLPPAAGQLIKLQPPPAPPDEPSSPLGVPREPARSDAPRPGRSQIIAAILEANGNLAEAARRLSLQRNQLRREVAYHNIDVGRLKDPKKL
jgi:transcriptional regulator with GAF, ATPase, and Fis domain